MKAMYSLSQEPRPLRVMSLDALPKNVIMIIAHYLAPPIKDDEVQDSNNALSIPYIRNLLRLAATCTRLRNLLTTTVEFRVHYNTTFGENLYWVGTLGDWEVLPWNVMEWTRGGYWRLNKQLVVGAGTYEYKYVMVDKNGCKHWWEKSANHKLELPMPPSPFHQEANKKYVLQRCAKQVHNNQVSVLQISSNLILSAEVDIKGWTQDLAFVFCLQPPHSVPIKALACSPGGHFLYSTDEHALLRMTDLATLQIVNDTWLEQPALEICVNEAEDLLYILTNWDVKIFDKRTMRIVQSLPCDYDLKDRSFNSAFVIEGNKVFIGSRLRRDQLFGVVQPHKTLRQYDLRRWEPCHRYIETTRNIKHMAKSTVDYDVIFATTCNSEDTNSIEYIDTTKLSMKILGNTDEVLTCFKVGPSDQLIWGSNRGATILASGHNSYIERLLFDRAPISAVLPANKGSAIYIATGTHSSIGTNIYKWTSVSALS